MCTLKPRPTYIGFDAGIEGWGSNNDGQEGGASDEDVMEDDEEMGIGYKGKSKKGTAASRGTEGTPKALFIWEAFLSSAKAGQPEYHMVLFDLNLVMSAATQRKASLPNYFTSFSLSLLESPQLLVPSSNCRIS